MPNGFDYFLGGQTTPEQVAQRRVAPTPQYADPGHAYIAGIPNDPGLFGPIAEDMRGPNKQFATQAQAMTKKLYDLYKAGDPDAVAAVQAWEAKTLGRGYADNPAGEALKKESFDKFGSKTQMTDSASWQAFMDLYGNLQGDMLERGDISDADRQRYEQGARFDREGRPQIDMRSLYPKLR